MAKVSTGLVVDDDLMTDLDAWAAADSRSRNQLIGMILKQAVAGWKVQQAVESEQRDRAQVAALPQPQAIGVVPMVCAYCGETFGVINADVARREREEGGVHFCRKCLALPEELVVERLAALQDMA